MSEDAIDPFPTDMGGRPAVVASAQVVRHHIRSARRQAKQLLKKPSTVGLHAFRIALRRLRTLVSLYRKDLPLSRDQRATLKALHRATSKGRDIDVARSWTRTLASRAGLEPALFDPYLPREKATPRSVFRAFKAWAKEAESQLRRIDLPPLEDMRTFAQTSADRLELEALPAILARLEDRPNQDALHKARLRLKKLRYTLEPLRSGPFEAAPLIEDCRLMQGWLGDARDLRTLHHRLKSRKAKGSARAELDQVATLAKDEAEARVLACLELGGHRRESEAEATFDAWIAAAVELQKRLGGGANLEIERKYLLTELPPHAKAVAPTAIDQGYLPGREIRERVRRLTREEDVRYRRTIKAGRGLQRLEFEEALDADTFDQLWPLTKGARVTKNRHVVREGEDVWEIDVFTDRTLVLAEIELARIEDEVRFPEWLAPYVVREVTQEKGFINQRLAR